MPTRGRRRASPAEAAHAGSYSSPACYLHEFEAAPTATPARGFEIKRVYEAAAGSDGFRILVDRLWPRGLSKERAELDAWLPDIAPSPALRRWFHHDPVRWDEFARRYRAELRDHAAQLQALRRRARQQRVTLLYGARDARINHARVLRDALRRSSAAR